MLTRAQKRKSDQISKQTSSPAVNQETVELVMMEYGGRKIPIYFGPAKVEGNLVCEFEINLDELTSHRDLERGPDGDSKTTSDSQN
ncbi:unnamed protein product [Orchesella dallaii]|uniref:Uncharacterized protein n=1 Tax=Orchesella dallaii TaxID=48710 RepID=A0ABP1R490_9HEXA